MRTRTALAAGVAAAIVLCLPGQAAAEVACPSPIPVVEENACAGPGSEAWRLTDPNPEIAGFATRASVDRGEDVVLKIGRSGEPAGTTTVDVSVFRIGYYGGAGGIFIPAASHEAVTVNNDQGCGSPDPTTGLLSCAGWKPTYTIPGASLRGSGVYVAHIRASDTGRDNQIVFVVRDDERAAPADVLFQLPMTTYEAYNNWGGKSLYDFNSAGKATVSGGTRAVKVSFDRPFANPTGYFNDWFFNADFALVSWLERQGYDVSYNTDLDSHEHPGELTRHRAVVLGGHDEYWSGEQFSAFEAAREAGVSIASFGADAAFWKVRYENGGRTLVCYKTVQGSTADGSAGANDWGPDGVEGTVDDALGADGKAGTADDKPGNATTTFRDDGAPAGDPNAPPGGRVGPDRPENSLFGSMYVGDRDRSAFPLLVPSGEGGGDEFAADRIWRHTNVPGHGAAIGSIVGWEWDAIPTQAQYLEHQPAGVKRLTESTPEGGNWLQDEGRAYSSEPPPGQEPIASAVKYRAASGALVFSAGTDQWGWGLGPHFFAGEYGGEPDDVSDPRLEQATANLFADMEVQPNTPNGIVLDSGNTPPDASFTASPALAPAGAQISFDASASSDPDGQIAHYEWDLDGNGSYETDTAKTPTTTHTYTEPGVHQVGLRVTDSGGASDTAQRSVTIQAPPSGPYAEAILASPGLIHYWRLGESTGQAFADNVGAAAATNSGATLGVPGAIAEDPDTAARFDGAGDSAQAALDLSGTDKLTVEFWLKWDRFANDDDLALEFTDNFNQHDGGILIDPDGPELGGSFGVGIGRNASRNNIFFARPSAGAYHHYAFVLDTTAPAESQILPYVDGAAVPFTKTASGTGAGNFASALLHLMSRNATTLNGAGDLDELAIYDRKLSPAEIASHHELGVGGVEEPENQPPDASFTASPALAPAGAQISFDASASSDPDGQIAHYEWDLDGNGSYETDTAKTPTTTHTYTEPGVHQVGLRVTDSGGASDTAQRSVTIQAPPSGPYAEAILASPGLIHYWRLGESTGQAFADNVGAAAATNSGATLGVPGAIAEDPDTAARFDGAGDSAQAALDLSGTDKLTVEFWLKWDRFANDDDLALEFTDNFNQHDGGILIDPDGPELGGSFGVGIGRNASRNNIFFARPSAGAYHHYAFVLDTTAPAESQILPYVDGAAVPFTKTASGTGAGNFASALLHLMSRNATTLNGAGDLDELAIYDRKLSPAEIASHHELGVGGVEEPENQPPDASFTASPALAPAGAQISFDASASSDPDGEIAHYEWDLDGNGSYETDTAKTPTTTHTYTEPGVHQVGLRVTDSGGASDTAQRSVTIQAPPSGPYAEAILASPGLIHYWRLGESTGQAFADNVGAAAATNSGATLGVPGAIAEDPDTAARFDGAGDSAQAALDLSGTDKLTVEFWLKWDRFANDDDLALEFTDNFNQHDGGILIDPDGPELGGSFGVGIGRNASRNNIFFARPSAGAYHHYAFVLDTTAPAESQILPYVDGAAVPFTKTASGTGAGNFASALLHLMSRNATTLNGAGDLDELAIYDRKLSPAEIASHHELGVGGGTGGK